MTDTKYPPPPTPTHPSTPGHWQDDREHFERIDFPIKWDPDELILPEGEQLPGEEPTEND